MEQSNTIEGIEPFRQTLAKLHNNNRITVRFERLDKDHAKYNDELLTVYTLESIVHGIPTRRDIFHVNVAIPNEVKMRVEHAYS